jgi:hypothetical protein
MGIAVSRVRADAMAVVERGARRRVDDGHLGWGESGGGDLDDGVLVDQLLLSTSGVLHGGGGDSVDVA